MKKTFFTLMLMFVTALALNAQSLTGKQWCTKMADEDGQDVVMSITFEKGGKCELLIGAEQEMKEDGVPITIVAGVTVPGTYTLNDKNLTINLNRGKAEVDIDYEIKGMGAKTKAMMDKQIHSELDGYKGEFKKLMLDGMPKMHNLTIVTLESKRLVVKNDDGAEIPFYAE